MRKKKNSTGVSPYVKYQKTPFSYTFRNCSHPIKVQQATPDWKGLICGRCGVIIRKFEEETKDRDDNTRIRGRQFGGHRTSGAHTFRMSCDQPNFREF